MVRVRVYRNLTRGDFSVQGKVNGSWKVIDHVDKITLRNPRFLVSESGRRRVVRERRKNVHAKIEGDQTKYRKPPGNATRIAYDPYCLPYFFWKDDCDPVEDEEYEFITIGDSGIWVF
jgi:hypothetical protein